MKHLMITVTAIVMLVVAADIVHADLDSFLSDLNVQAQADLPGFNAKLSIQFGIPLLRVETIIHTVEYPADAFMCFQLGEIVNRSPEYVLQTYQGKKHRGWGVIAKELGIKPGSAEFHALKNGDFSLTGEPSSASGKKSWKKGKGKAKGHKK